MAKITEFSRPVQVTSSRPDRSIGALLVDSGLITAAQAEQVIALQKRDSLRFGEAAVKLGMVAEKDIQRVLATQFDYPYLHTPDAGIGTEVVAAYEPFSSQVERLRALRSQLILRWFSSDQRVLMVSSPRAKDGRTYLCANLGVVFSQLGERTLIIDGDMRSPRMHSLFNLPNRSGLSTFLSGREEPEPIRIPSLMDLSVLPAGPVPPNPQELLARPLFAELIESAKADYDVVLVDSSPADSSADAQSIARVANGSIVVARKNRTLLSDVQALVGALTSAGSTVVGTVLNAH